MNCDVSISRCESYEPEVVKAGLLAALSPIGGLDWVKPGMKIALKVNMMMQIKPEKAGTVHPQIATALCELLVERGASVVVGDSPGGPFSAAFLAGVYSTTGMRQVLKSGATLNDNFAMIERMRAIDTSGIEPMSHPLGGAQRLRDDAVTDMPDRAATMRNAPESEDGLFLVPKVIE